PMQEKKLRNQLTDFHFAHVIAIVYPLPTDNAGKEITEPAYGFPLCICHRYCFPTTNSQCRKRNYGTSLRISTLHMSSLLFPHYQQPMQEKKLRNQLMDFHFACVIAIVSPLPTANAGKEITEPAYGFPLCICHRYCFPTTNSQCRKRNYGTSLRISTLHMSSPLFSQYQQPMQEKKLRNQLTDFHFAYVIAIVFPLPTGNAGKEITEPAYGFPLCTCHRHCFPTTNSQCRKRNYGTSLRISTLHMSSLLFSHHQQQMQEKKLRNQLTDFHFAHVIAIVFPPPTANAGKDKLVADTPLTTGLVTNKDKAKTVRMISADT
ncbi:hypothetical protein BgiMline_004107, partial [Biomphalaria glabrata]